MPRKERDSESWGELAEQSAARKYGLERVENDSWFDAYYRSNGRKVQIKSCHKVLESGRTGRFRFWRRDHTKIKENSGSYIVVLTDADSKKRPVAKIEKVPVRDVGKAAEWGPSGHSAKNNDKQAKIPWPELLK